VYNKEKNKGERKKEMNEEKALVLIESEEKQEPEAGAVHPMATLLKESGGVESLQRGQILEGTIVYSSPSEILIDVGAKSEGIVGRREMSRLDADFLSELNVGDSILTYVLVPEDKNGNIILSLTRAQIEKDWRKAERLFKDQEIFESTVAGYNKGGLIARLGQVRGFVPASQIVTRKNEDLSSEEFKAQLVGETLQLKIIELDRSRNRLILSERAAVRDWRRQQKEKLLDDLHEGAVRTGIVSSLCDFGAFVDLGDADGLVHLSEISWRRVKHPSQVLKVGQEVEVYILKVDRERKRIGLSLKRLEPDPWTLVDDLYELDQLVEGTITKLLKFGAFARLQGSDIEGLIHISELSQEHITHPKEVVQEGQVLTLRIIKIESDRRRMGLSLKRVDSAEYIEQDWTSGYIEEEEAAPPQDEAIDSDSPEAPEETIEVEAASEEETIEQEAAPPQDEAIDSDSPKAPEETIEVEEASE